MAMAGNQAKTMSSRLATMKFMQRNAGPGDTSGQPAAKRQRMLDRQPSGPSTPSTPHSVSGRANGLTPDSRSQADGEWYLSFTPPPLSAEQSPFRISSAGYSSLDVSGGGDRLSESEQDETPGLSVGRKSFGKFNRKLEKEQNTAANSDSDSLSEDEDGDDPGGQASTGVDALIAQGRKDAAERIRAERKAKRKADGAGLQQLGEERRKKEIKLNRLSGISSGGNHSPASNAANATCYTCGKKGHVKKDCPKSQSGSSKGRKSY